MSVRNEIHKAMKHHLKKFHDQENNSNNKDEDEAEKNTTAKSTTTEESSTTAKSTTTEESSTTEEEEEGNEDFTGQIEGFGNLSDSKFPIDLILKSIFFGAIFYLLSLPEVYKLTKKCCKQVDGVLLHSIVFAILYFILSQFIN